MLIIDQSEISETAKIFSDVRIVNSVIGDDTVIGDNCDCEKVFMNDKSELGRRNLVRDSRIGRGTYTGTNTIIKSADIGNYCSISWNVSIGGMNHPYDKVSMYTDYWVKRTFGIDIERSQKPLKTIIGNDVWIASGAVVLEGIKIGNGCVIGAGAVITKDIEPYSIVVGVPGRVTKKRFSEEIINALEKIKWWDWDEEKIKTNIDFIINKPNLEMISNFL